MSKRVGNIYKPKLHSTRLSLIMEAQKIKEGRKEKNGQ